MRTGKVISKGDKFGELTVVSNGFIKKQGNTSRYFFKLRCSCGALVSASATQLRLKVRVSCKDCSWRRRSLKREPVSQIEQLYNQKIVLVSKARAIPYNLAVFQFEELIKSNCYYCGSNPLPNIKFKKRKYINTDVFKTNGIDRLDSSKGYIVGNCVPCCATCNTMKMDMSVNEFLIKISEIYHHQKLD